MKYLFFLLILFIVGKRINAQSFAEQLSAKIATRMQDSLLLTDSQKQQLVSINLSLHQQKDQARELYSGTDSLGKKIQRVENTRDSIYRTILTQGQNILYKEKKRYLVTNN